MFVHLIRHTRTAVGSGICYGRLDVALASTWRFDIEDCLRLMPSVSQVISSPSTRCRTLANALGKRESIAVRIDERLCELNFGDWEGRAWDAIPKSDIDAWAANLIHYAPGNGESLGELWNRIDAFQRDLDQGHDEIAIVSHHGPLRALAAQIADETPAKMFTRQWPWGSIRRSEIRARQIRAAATRLESRIL